MVGDFLSVAILPPSTVDGSVASASAARMGRGYGMGSGQASLGPTMDYSSDGRGLGRDRGFGDTRGGHGGRMMTGGGAGGRFERDGRDGRAPVPPLGEWRRGERLPDAPSMRGRGRGRPRW